MLSTNRSGVGSVLRSHRWHQCLLICLWIILSWLPGATQGNWMYLGVAGLSPLMPRDAPSSGGDSVPYYIPTVCDEIPGLTPKQIDLCRHYPRTIKSVSRGALMGIVECQHQFRNDRWNCTTNEQDTNVFGYTIKRGSRETAFIYAVTSAGVVQAITQACSAGNLTDCSCDQNMRGETPEGWKWGGCSDNLRYGVTFSEAFVDSPEREKYASTRNLRAKMNLHNNAAGRQAIASMLRTQCRCHGVSGSCELKTCWQTLPRFAEVGDYLKLKYENSVKIRPTDRPKRRTPSRKRSRGRRDREGRTVRWSRRHSATRRDNQESQDVAPDQAKPGRSVPLQQSDLVHLRRSPNYCRYNPKKGILGTSGRVCNNTSTEQDGCDFLCCGRGYNTQIEVEERKCRCIFHWCCYVTCETCRTVREIYTCK